jgi:P27 family predicted phage terminase small subunit
MEKSYPIPPPPQELTTDGYRLWTAITAEYELDNAALEVLGMACEAYSRSRQAADLVDKEGLITLDRFGQPHENVAVKMERDARGQCLTALKIMGLNLEPIGSIGRPNAH